MEFVAGGRAFFGADGGLVGWTFCAGRVRWPRRLGIHDGLDQVGGRARPRTSRMLPGQQEIEQHAQGINIGGCGYSFTLQLLGSRVFGRQGPPTLNSELCWLPSLFFALQQLCYAEIEQLYLAVFANENV